MPNIKMQKTGARVEFGAVCPLPASDLGRWKDEQAEFAMKCRPSFQETGQLQRQLQEYQGFLVE